MHDLNMEIPGIYRHWVGLGWRINDYLQTCGRCDVIQRVEEIYFMP